MCIKSFPLNRNQLIKEHVQSMLDFALELEHSDQPFKRSVLKRDVAARVRSCASSLAKANAHLELREKAIDQGRV